jgi:hypothetical protein
VPSKNDLEDRATVGAMIELFEMIGAHIAFSSSLISGACLIVFHLNRILLSYLATLEIFQQASSGVLLLGPTLERFQRFRVTRLFVIGVQVKLTFKHLPPALPLRSRGVCMGNKPG